MISFILDPFQYEFMRKALVSCLCLTLGSTPVGVFLVLRRMSLMGDALSHAILPGCALGYILMGLSVWALSIGGFIAGLCVALLSGLVSRLTSLKEDASFAGFFLIALASGVLIISTQRNTVDLVHILFGSALAIDNATLFLMGTIASFSLISLSVLYRPLVIECFDPQFFASVGGKGTFIHTFFLTLVVLNLVSGFQALGTLLSLGMMMLPAISARFWAQNLFSTLVIAACSGLISGIIGLYLSYYIDWPSGPSIILIAGIFYIFSLLWGRYGSIFSHKKSL